MSSTECQIIYLITQEKSTSQIATELKINLNEVINSRQRIYEKLGILNTAGMIRRAFELKILDTEGDRCILSNNYQELEKVETITMRDTISSREEQVFDPNG